MPLKRKNCTSLPLTPFPAMSHHAHFQTKPIDKSIAFSQIYWSIIVDQIHTYQILQTDLVWPRMLSWFSKNCWLLVLGGSFNVLQLIFGCVPPRDPARPFGSKYLSPIHTTYQSGIVGQGGEQGQRSKKRWQILYQFMKKKILDNFQSINCINVSIHGCNSCKTGIEVSKCV